MQTYDRMQAAFPGEQFTADIVVEGGNLDQAQIQAAATEMRQIARDSDQFQEPVTVDVSPDKQVAVIEVPLAGSPARTTHPWHAVKSLRDDVVPQVFPSVTGGEVVGVSGLTAGSLDFNELMAAHIWYVFAFVFAVAFLLLLVTFRSVVIPIKAILLNVLSVAAALGIVTYVFQDGHFEDFLNFDSTGAITAWFPLMLFVILFGLSMDYHVFILSRIKEAVDRGASTEDAVSTGIKSTAGVVTAAAIVMVGVFGIFATLQFIDMKQFGVGLAAAILIDATLVRGVLLPATMKLLGDWNWYLPKWLEWLPKGPALEGSPEPPTPERRARCGRTRGRPRRRPRPHPLQIGARPGGGLRSFSAVRDGQRNLEADRPRADQARQQPVVAAEADGGDQPRGRAARAPAPSARTRSRARAWRGGGAGCAWRPAPAASRRRCSPCGARRRAAARAGRPPRRAPAWRLRRTRSARTGRRPSARRGHRRVVGDHGVDARAARRRAPGRAR